MYLKRAEIKITGLVQGVFFREGVRAEAEWLGITGWARNEDDGSVMLVAEGQERQLQELVEWCRKGTIGARVDQVDIQWQEATGKFERFEVR